MSRKDNSNYKRERKKFFVFLDDLIMIKGDGVPVCPRGILFIEPENGLPGQDDG